MTTLNVTLRKNTDLNNISINDVVYSIDSKKCRHSNQYLKPEGGLYKYKDYIILIKEKLGDLLD